MLKYVQHDQFEQRTDVNTIEPCASNQLLHTLFMAQVKKQPLHPAVVWSNGSMSYKTLYHLSNQIGYQLVELGAHPNMLVGVAMEKGWEQVAAVLGILQLGAAYIPINPENPETLLRDLLLHGKVELVLTQPWLNDKLTWPDGIRCLLVDEYLQESHHAIEPVSSPDDIACVLCPVDATTCRQGVMLTHLGLVNTILYISQFYAVGPDDRVLAYAPLTSDLSIYDIFGTLAAGGTIIMPAASDIQSNARLVSLISNEQVTIWNSVPASIEMLIEYLASQSQPLPSSLRLILLSKDWIPISLPNRIRALSIDVHLAALGGTTKTSIWSTLHPIEKVDPEWTRIPYGRPIANQNVYILNEMMKPCPTWVPGQIYIGGVGLAKGYWCDEGNTKKNFITHFQHEERLYRTGDIGRYLPNGEIDFLGKEDTHIRINDRHVALREIETILLQHPQLRNVVVTVASESEGEKHLVAYVVPHHAQTPDLDELSSFSQGKLPKPMRPSNFVLMSTMPLTPHGKIDRKSLSARPFIPTPAKPQQKQQAEMTSILTHLARLVAGVLEVESVDPEANLFDLGINSVDLLRVVNKVEVELGFRPDIEELFRVPSVKTIAQYYEQSPAKNSQPVVKTEATNNLNAASSAPKLLIDPEERDTFKKRQPGIRHELVANPYIQLIGTEVDDELIALYAQRRSYRKFALNPIPFDRFSMFLSVLRQITLDGQIKYRYASAGGLYPVQTYLHIKAGRVQGVHAGTYYYHPIEHRLVTLTANIEIDRNIHSWINRPIFDQAAFSLFLIGQFAAIEPMYGEVAREFCIYESGSMGQLLMMNCFAHEIGLCGIGGLEFERIHHLFGLTKDHVLLHTLLGGLIDPKQARDINTNQEQLIEGNSEKITQMLDKIKQLSDDEVRTMLDEKRKLDEGMRGENAPKPNPI